MDLEQADRCTLLMDADQVVQTTTEWLPYVLFIQTIKNSTFSILNSLIDEHIDGCYMSGIDNHGVAAICCFIYSNN